MAKAKYVGCGIDKHDHTCIAHLYEIEINGDPFWVVFREYRNGKMQLHGISDSPDIVKNVTKNRPPSSVPSELQSEVLTRKPYLTANLLTLRKTAKYEQGNFVKGAKNGAGKHL